VRSMSALRAAFHTAKNKNQVQEISKELLAAKRLAWARRCFLEELNTDLHRFRKFDDFFSVELVSVLERQSRENLLLLAQALPLGVFWERPDSQERRQQLPEAERLALAKFRADYNAEVIKNSDRSFALIGEARTSRPKPEYKVICKQFKAMLKSIAKDSNYLLVGGAIGELGLQIPREWGKVILAFCLDPSMTFTYSITFIGKDHDRILSKRNYLLCLGVVRGSWSIQSINSAEEKLLSGVQFAQWHLQALLRLLEEHD
jgi:hypothetical protein